MKYHCPMCGEQWNEDVCVSCGWFEGKQTPAIQRKRRRAILQKQQAKEKRPALVIAHVCGGQQARRCADGGEHDMSVIIRYANGGSVACAKCGVTAMDMDVMRLP